MPTPDNPFEHIITPAILPSAWPPAVIYWVISGALIVTAILSWYLIQRHIKAQKIVKNALSALQQLQDNSADFVQLNQLLKAISLHYYPRSKVASLTGDAWFLFLKKHSVETKQLLFVDKNEFCQRLYQQHSTCSEFEFSAAKQWIEQFPAAVKRLQKSAREEQYNV